MKSVIYKGNGEIALEDIPKPEIKDDTDVIVKVSLTSICGSDIHLLHDLTLGAGPAPFSIGHEFMGVIEEVGSKVKGLKVGDRVAGPPAVSCGECFACRHGLPGHCENGGIFGHGAGYGGLDGAMSEYVRVPRADFCLVKVPDRVTDEQALFVGDILTTGYSCAVDGKIQHGDTVVVYGVGPVGLCAMLAAKLYDPVQVIAIGGHDKTRTEMAKDLGADVVLLSSEVDDIPGKIRELTEGRGADVALECAGNKTSLTNALDCIRIGGHVACAAVYGAPVELDLPMLSLKNVTLTMGLGDVSLMPTTMKLVEAGYLDATKLITQRMPLDEALEAFDIFEHRTEPCIKIALRP